MTKQLLVASTLLMLLCGPALATPAPAPHVPMQLDFRIEVGKDVRHYAIELVDQDCGEIHSKSHAKTLFTEDTIRVCARSEGPKFVVDVDWSTQDADHEIRTKSVALVSRNASFNIDGGNAKLTTTIQ